MKILKHILTPILGLVVVLSTFSFQLNKHYCLGRLMDVSLSTEVSCTSNNTGTCELGSKSPCCENHAVTVEGKDVEAKAPSKIPEFSEQTVLTSAVTWLKDLVFQFISSNTKTLSDSGPPLIKEKQPAFTQVFLL